MKTRRLDVVLLLSLTATALLTGLAPGEAFALQPGVTVGPKVTVYKAPPAASAMVTLQDMANARPMPLPKAYLDPQGDDVSTETLGPRGFSPGGRGTGRTNVVRLPRDVAPESDASGVLLNELEGGFTTQEFGTSNHPFTTARVDTSGTNVSWTRPYSAVGKLYFKIGTATYVCSASLIKRGVIVTAAHCVAEFGRQTFYTGFQFVPGKYNSLAPYGIWGWATVTIKTSYYNGTDVCAPGATGVVCQNDVAVIRLAGQVDMDTGATTFPGTQTGWLGYGYGGYGFTPGNLALLSQLGYPVSHDGGRIMHRTDSQAFVSASLAGNSVWGSRMTGGSSGGPEIVNLGIRGTLTTPIGSEANANVVVGVTSWGYVNAAVKQQGASPFTSNNIVALVTTACAGTQPACQ